jgi:chemotaxis protein MotB
MARMRHLVGVVALGLLSFGCVSQEKYTALQIERDTLAQQLGRAQSDASAARAEAASYKSTLDSIRNSGGTLEALVANLQQQNANLQAQYDELNKKYLNALNNTMPGGPLPAPLSNELQLFANQNPDLVEFDAQRGMVKFKSDVTFAVGDATLTPKAREVINRFATILNSPNASSYELLVAGHTDNAPVTNPRTIQAGHKNNWYLSAHRAIAVAEGLFAQKVAANRVGVLGYADQRPIASNASESGKQQNRRVEVLILPTQVRSAPVAQPSTPKQPTANVDTNPALNK